VMTVERMPKRTLLPPAKLNLSLRLTGRRGNGYHLIESVIVPVSLFDRLEVQFDRAEGDIQVLSESPNVPSGPSNLVFRAADIIRRRTCKRFSLTVKIRKHIPVGSGLGGGSSDAAAILAFLNLALGSPFDQSALAAIGSELGADVPFFVHGRPAVVRGIGEVVEPLPKPLDIDLVICSAGVHLSTATVYARADQLSPADKAGSSLTTVRPESNIASFVDGYRPLTELLANDLEEAAAQICPEVHLLKNELLRRGAQGASMTGSGSAVFGVCPDAESAERLAAALRRKGLWACSTKTLGTPL